MVCGETKMTRDSVRTIAFYLPQYHPIPENDAWWGKGFTEWTNVTKARPLFRGHYQPHLPAELGFYDLRLPEARAAQAALAREHGIDGFCYYHYWFSSKRLLNRPFDEVLTSGKPDFPFCLCWANENWTRRWDGQDYGQVLMEQTYSEEDDLQHIRWLSGAFADERYLRINGKPLFIIYRAHKLPNLKRTIDLWRNECHRLGIGEVFLCRVDTVADTLPPHEGGLDAAVEFQPDWSDFGATLGSRGLRHSRWNDLRFFLRRKLLGDDIGARHYGHLVSSMSTRIQPDYPRFPCITPSWDNSPRCRQRATVFIESSPALFQQWAASTLARLKNSRNTPPILFINAWNEWAEGNHLEPDQRYGRSYLQALKEALRSVDGR
jgi:lipopolysaccharide biosynthesis protein